MAFLDDLHKEEVKALSELIRICKKHNLKFYVIGGTLIGAVRHKGFIPWDDDVDVGMPRPDYDKFLTIVNSEIHDPFVVDDYHWDDSFKSYFCKMRSKNFELKEKLTDNENFKRIGYLIDIIPIDGTPDNKLARKFYYAKVLWLRFLCGTANVTTGIRTSRPKWEQNLLKIVKGLKLYKLIKIHKVYQRMDKLFKKQKCKESKYAGTITGAYKTHEIVDNTLWGYDEEPVWMDFENIQVPCPVKWHEYLTFMFGDYMQLPPEEKRKTHYQEN